MSNKVEFTKKVVFQQDIDGQDNSVASSFISDFSEAVDSRVYSLLVAGNNIVITYNDDLNKLVISSTASGGGSGGDAQTLNGEEGSYYLDWDNFINIPSEFNPSAHTHPATDIVGFGEAVDDRVYSLLVAGTNVVLSYDDTANTITINVLGEISGTVEASNVTNLSEAIDDRVYSLIVAGSNISIQYDDTANTLTINSLGGADAATLDGQEGTYYLDWTNFTNVPSTFPPSSHTHTSSAITDFNYSVYSSLVAGSNISLAYEAITGKTTVTALGGTDAATLDGQDGSYYLDWTNFTNVPSTFPPSSHTHTSSAITDFNYSVYSSLVAGSNISLAYNAVTGKTTVTALGGTDAATLDGQDGSYYLDWTNFTNIPSTFPPSSHTHTASQITDFNNAVDSEIFSYVIQPTLFASYTHNQTASTISDFSESVDDRVYSLLTAGTNITLSYNDSSNTLTINSKGDAAILSNFSAYPDLGNYGRWFEVDSTDLWGDGRIPFSITINKSDNWFNVPTAIYPLNSHGFPAAKTNFTRRYKIALQSSGTARSVYLASDSNWENGYKTGYFWVMLYDVATSSIYYSAPIGNFEDENKYLKLFTVDLPADIDLTKKYFVKVGIFWDSTSASWPTSNQGGDSIPNNYNNYGQDCAFEIHTMTLVAYDVMPS